MRLSPPLSELTSILEAAGLDGGMTERLAAYGTLLLAANRKLNLTAARTEAALAEHILDALTLQSEITDAFVDVGAGGGLPGIPLAIATGAAVLFVEATAKKAAFLSAALDGARAEPARSRRSGRKWSRTIRATGNAMARPRPGR